MSDDHPLVCRFGALGDMVMLTALLKRLYLRCGKPADVVGIGNWSASLFEHMPYVRHVYTVSSRKTPYFLSRSQQQLARQLRAHQYRYAWIAEVKRKSYRLMSAGGIDVKRSVNAQQHPALPGEHFVAQWQRLANLSPPEFDFPVIEDDTLNTELFVSKNEVDACKQWLASRGIRAEAPLVCIQVGNKRTTRAGRVDRESNTKYWPEKNWAQVIDGVTEQLPDAQVLLCGVPAELSITRDIHDMCAQPQQVFCVADDLPLRRLLALLSIAHSCISVDTGPAHAAAALNCPLTVLFGKADPARYRPVSSQSKVQVVSGAIPQEQLSNEATRWEQVHDIRFITVDNVLENWQRSV